MLFLDELTARLDPVASRDVHAMIAELGRSAVTILLTTHRLEEAEGLCNRVAILNTTLRTIGRSDELRERLFAEANGSGETAMANTSFPCQTPRSQARRSPGRSLLPVPTW